MKNAGSYLETKKRLLEREAAERVVAHIVKTVAGNDDPRGVEFGGILSPMARDILVARGYETACGPELTTRFFVRKARAQPSPPENPFPRHTTFKLGDPVRKIPRENGASWRGHVVGFYSTEINPEGYAVESWFEPGSVQIYPVSALQRDPNGRSTLIVAEESNIGVMSDTDKVLVQKVISVVNTVQTDVWVPIAGRITGEMLKAIEDGGCEVSIMESDAQGVYMAKARRARSGAGGGYPR